MLCLLMIIKFLTNTTFAGTQDIGGTGPQLLNTVGGKQGSCGQPGSYSTCVEQCNQTMLGFLMESGFPWYYVSKASGFHGIKFPRHQVSMASGENNLTLPHPHIHSPLNALHSSPHLYLTRGVVRGKFWSNLQSIHSAVHDFLG